MVDIYHMVGAFIKIPTTDKQVVFGPFCIIILQSGSFPLNPCRDLCIDLDRHL